MQRPVPALRALIRPSSCIRWLHSKRELAKHLESPQDLKVTLEKFKSAFTQNSTDSLSVRPQLYELIRSNDFKYINDDFLALVPPGNRYLFDQKFICEYLLNKNPGSLKVFLRGMIESDPAYAENLLNYAVLALVEAEKTFLAVDLFADILMELGIDPSSLNKFSDQSHIASLKSIASSAQFIPALKQLADRNLVLASRLSSAIIQQFISIANTDTIKNTWELKKQFGLLRPSDLHWIMLFYVYIGEPNTALEVHDLHQTLHDGSHNDALLLACAQSMNWNRLQTTFEQIESKNTTSTNYEITLRALGVLGGPLLLDQVVENMKKASPVLSLPVYHALIYSYGKLGHTEKVKTIFYKLCEEQKPTRLTFNLLLSALKNSTELTYAQDIVAKMIGEYQIPMSNFELTQILGLCAAKKDITTARSVFKWCKQLFEPDQISWNAYLRAISSDGDAVYQEWKSMPHKSDIFTLTAVLTPYAKYGNVARFKEILAEKKRLGLKSDTQWLGVVLMYHRSTRNVKQAERVFQELRSTTKNLPSGYYATLMDLYIELKQGNKAQELFKLVQASKVPAGMDFYAKYLRVLMSYDSGVGIELARRVLKNIFKEPSVYEMNSRYVPRTSVPSGVVKPVVRGLIKNGSFDEASELITLTEEQNPQISDLWVIPALQLELASSSKRFKFVPRYWRQFIENLKTAFVPIKIEGRTVYKLPSSERHTFWRQINIHLEYLINSKSFKEAIAFPTKIEKLGLEMNTSNWNYLVKQLATCGSDPMVIEAYKIAESKLALNWLKSVDKKDKIKPLLDTRSIRILHSMNRTVVQALARKESKSVEEIWNNRMTLIFPRVNMIFNIVKTKFLSEGLKKH